MIGSSSEAGGTAGIAEQCLSLPRYLCISDTIQGTAIRKECSRSRYTTRTTDINPATLKSGTEDQTTHSKGILYRGGVANPKRPTNEVNGSWMTKAPSRRHPSRVLPLAESLTSHNGLGKMGADRILTRCHPSTGSGMVRYPFRRHSRIGKNVRYNSNRGVIRTTFSQAAVHRRIRFESTGRGATGDKQVARNVTGRPRER